MPGLAAGSFPTLRSPPSQPQAVASAAQASLLRQQEELERKAAELGTEGAELQEHGTSYMPERTTGRPCLCGALSNPASIRLLHRDPCRLPPDMQDALLSLDAAFSDTVSESACLPDLVLSQHLQGSRLWPLHPVVCDLHPPCLPFVGIDPPYKAFRSDNSFSFFVLLCIFLSNLHYPVDRHPLALGTVAGLQPCLR